LVIGNNWRSSGVSDQDWNSFVGSLSSGEGYFDGTGSAAYWYPGRSTRGSGSSSVTVVTNGLDNLMGYNDDNYRRSILIGSPSQVIINTGSTVSSDVKQRAIDSQYAANRALDDLNTLIGQLTASVGVSTSAVDRLTQTLAGYKSTGSQCNDKIL
jgi:hypothetical protein